jgi:hypothetical protein
MIGDGDCEEIDRMKIARRNRSTRKKTGMAIILNFDTKNIFGICTLEV